MQSPEMPEENGPLDHVIVKADEVDQTGTDISTVPDEQLMAEVAQGLQNDHAGAQPEGPILSTTDSTGGHPRPQLQRHAVAPPPPMQAPPPAPMPQDTENPTDSLSLVQLRRLVQEMPRSEQPAYTFEYADAQPFPEELDEWFHYNESDRLMLLGTKISFEHHWKEFCESQPDPSVYELSWLDADYDLRRSFIEQMLEGLENQDLFARTEALEALCYTLTGVWGLTAGKSVDHYPDDMSPEEISETPKFKSLQIKWIEKNVLLLQECSGIPALYSCMRNMFDKDRPGAGIDAKEYENDSGDLSSLTALERESNLILTALYVVVEVGRREDASDSREPTIKNTLASLKPNFLVLLVEILARLRWDDATNIPLTRIILLLWKSLLLLFGGSDSLAHAKSVLEPELSVPDDSDTSHRMPFLTASPLDYHVFRQELTSKYPAYNPPAPLVPLELESNSILPPLPRHSLSNSASGLFSGVGPSTVSGNGSILHQSVHIATPAPSPPPSPIGPGGKAGKKQNYQTNQNFPFMYPPLDDSSNNIGGKGGAGLQDALVGKKWDGSDVPASIIEAGKLFSSRMKLTRAMKQLWEERERFMKFDRGWDAKDSDSRSIEGFKLDDEESVDIREDKPKRPQGCEKETDDEDVQWRLDAVEDFYSQAMPNLQSIVIVLLKVILTNVTAIVSQNNVHGQSANGSANVMNGNGHAHGQESSESLEFLAVEELENTRLREITQKGVSGALLLMLKWFKRSHILKFEYVTQLLLDSNYLPLILKMFAHQDVDRAVAQPNDRPDLSFFHFCHVHSQQPPEHEAPVEADEADSDDEAVPPPILRHQPTQTAATDSSLRGMLPDERNEESIELPPELPPRPEVDELGYPMGPVPKDPITTYSWRNFFSAINYLHIMQKITRDKAHRCLLLVQYKSSTILRKGIKIPDPHLRLYTLKLFKSQVPYCGRKWRQSNMRVITAIYLYCKPELRDDWLAGSDVDAEIEDALPLEQALRGLTHWWHLRRYKDSMGIEECTALMEEERDFFVRELENMGWGFIGDEVLGNATGASEEGDASGVRGNGTEWDGGPLQMEGW